MAEYIIQSGTLDAIANAIRAKKGTSNSMTPAQMADEITGISGVENAEWHQCPEPVRNYLAAAAAVYPYDEDVTVIDQYAPAYGREVVANTKPVAYTIGGKDFFDNEPLVAEPFATEHKAGTLMALDKLRWYNTTPAPKVEGSKYPRGVNCRDLGGWACDGGTVRYGMLVRGGEPNGADKELMVNKIGIKTEVQILPISEQGTDYKMKSAWGIDWSGNDTNDDFYDGLQNKPLWKKLLSAIMDSVIHSKPVFFHCGIGADRTGIVAMALLGILGVAQSDIDQDYELTNFYMGWQSLSGGIYRSRVYSTQKSLMSAIKSIPLANGLTDSIRNRWVSFALSCGISIDKINAFRSACINGTPDVITVIVPTYTISRSGNHVAYDNDIVTVSENDQYSVGVTSASGYVISDVSVVMGGADITSQVFRGTPTVRRVRVVNNLTHCTTSNSANVAEAGSVYAATITADEGFTLDGATVQIMMGGTNVSQYYNNGTINIPSVTGDVVISVTAVESVRVNLFDPNSALYNKRPGYSDGGERTYDGGLITNMIDITNLSIITVEGIAESAIWDSKYAVTCYYAGSTFGQNYVGYTAYKNATYIFDVAAYKEAHPTATHIALYFGISTAVISAADVTDLAIYGE